MNLCVLVSLLCSTAVASYRMNTVMQMSALNHISHRDFATINYSMTKNPTGVRLFNPYFPLEILKSIDGSTIENILLVRQATNTSPVTSTERESSGGLERLPWLPFPSIGIPESKTFLSKSEIGKLYEKSRHLGHIIW